MTSTTLYQLSSRGKIKTWTIEVEDATISITWGLKDGKLQTSKRTVSDCGVEGHADYLTPEQNAVLVSTRQIVKKKEEGYTDHEPVLDADADITDPYTYKYISSFPKNMCFYKPQNSPKIDHINTLAEDGKLFATYKRDGMMHILHKDDAGTVRFYTRRMDEATARFPHLVEQAELTIPPNTILIGEMVLENYEGMYVIDDFENGISRICRSDPEKAVARQKEIGEATYCIFDTVFVDGAAQDNKTIVERREAITSYLDVSRNVMGIDDEEPREYVYAKKGFITMCYGFTYVASNRQESPACKSLKNRARDIGMEGYVVWDAEAKLDLQSLVRFNGKPKRPSCVWKLKPKNEDDFIAKFDPDNGVGMWYKDTDRSMLGKASLYSVRTSEHVGDVGTGFSMEQRKELVNSNWPRTWAVEYDRKTEKGNLRFPVFLRDRTTHGDK